MYTKPEITWASEEEVREEFHSRTFPPLWEVEAFAALISIEQMLDPSKGVITPANARAVAQRVLAQLH